MSGRLHRVRRSPAERAVRLALSGLAAVLGGYGVAFSIAQVVAAKDPALAHRFAPYDGRITARLATSIADDEATAADRLLSDRLATLALRQDPTATLAISTLGLNADVRKDTTAARRYFTYGQKLSRRDLRTQLWMIEDAVGRESVPQALRQYDITLRVFPNLGEMLFPVLASASSDRQIRIELVRVLAGKPLWADNFITFATRSNLDARSIAALLRDLRIAGVTVPEPARSAGVDTLIAAGQLDEAWSYYASIRSDTYRRRSRNLRVAGGLEAPSSLDWMPINEGGLTGDIQGGVFDFAAPASVGGVLLKQAQLLPPGRYRLGGRSSGIELSPQSRPYWVMTCSDGRELGRVEVPNSSVADGAFAGVFAVPANCQVQTLMLVARPSDAVTGLSGQINEITLAPTAE